MTSADFSQFVVATLQFASTLFLRACEISSGKNIHLHLIYLPHLRFGVRAVTDFVLIRKLVRSEYALYAVSVRQTEALH